MVNSAAVDTGIVTLLIGAMVALLHGTFQVSASVLTLLSSHRLGARSSHRRVIILAHGYVVGVVAGIAATLLGIISLIHAVGGPRRGVWIVAILIAAVVGCLTCLVYYRQHGGTTLWLPRPIAEYLSDRARRTNRSAEAAALGAMTVVAELPFTIAPLTVAALIIAGQPLQTGLSWVVLYSLCATLPLGIIVALLGGGHKLSAIQRWREHNKQFLQYSSGIGLITIALYIVVFYLAGVTI